MLDALFMGTRNNPMHINARQVDQVGVKAAKGDNLLHFGDAYPAAGGGRYIEIAGCLAEDEVS